MEASLDDEIERLHVKLSVIHALLGERSAEFGTQSDFEILAHCMSTVRSLQEVVSKRLEKPMGPEVLNRLETMDRKMDQTTASAKSLVQEGLNKFFGDKSEFRQQFVNPTLSLLSRSSIHTGDPGGKWASLIADLSARMENKECLRIQVGGGGGGSFGWATSSSTVGGLNSPSVNFVGTGVQRRESGRGACSQSSSHHGQSER